ncbi:MAG: FAD-binding oxidoreductase [Pseudomonadota bacterium]
MTRAVDVLVIGGGIAGMSLAAKISGRVGTVVLERESALGYHSSGRSATFYHFGIGNDAVRGLTAASSHFFESPPAQYAAQQLWQAKAALFISDEARMPQLETLAREMARFTDTIQHLGPDEMLEIVPVLRTGGGGIAAGLLDTAGRKLDADALLQANYRALKSTGGSVMFDTEVLGIDRDGQRWLVRTGKEIFSAAVVVNAAGAWADPVAAMAGVKPLGLRPLRRTIIGFEPPDGMDVSAWPFVKTAYDDGFYMLPDAGRLLASPMDVTPSPACDVQPEEFEMALAAWRVEQATTLNVARISARWAGLRTFAADQVPTAGFAPDAPNFFWLAGQGGYGLQTSPAMADAAEALMFDLPWPDHLAAQGLRPEQIRPERLF